MVLTISRLVVLAAVKKTATSGFALALIASAIVFSIIASIVSILILLNSLL